MKKLFALLLTVVMMASMMVPAMAEEDTTVGGYEAATPENTTITHKLKLTDENATGLEYDIQYTFTVDDPTYLAPNGEFTTAPENSVEKNPSIEGIVYGPTDKFTDADMTEFKTLTVDWSEVKITQPGIYRWEVTQHVTENAPQDASGNNVKFYLFVYATDNNGKLDTSVLMSKSEVVTAGNKTVELPETYPAKTVDLEIIKQVTGNQGSKEQYFPFTVKLTAPAGVTNALFKYTLTGSFDEKVPETSYHGPKTNLKEIEVKNGYVEFVVWLKDGQSVKINDIIYNTAYEITEAGNDGYGVSAVVSGGDVTGTYAAMKTTDDGLIDNATVTYTNTKSTEVPTGISLQTGVAFFGFVLAMGMMVLMFVGKRKEQN